MRYLVVLCAILAVSYGLHPKHLAGPPSEFSSNLLPTPATAALEERSASLEIRFKPDASHKSSWVGTLPVDSDTIFSFSTFLPESSKTKLTLRDPQGKEVDLSSHMITGDLAAFPIGLESIPGTNYLFEAPFPKGLYTVTIETISPISVRLDSEPDGLLILFNESPIKAHTFINTYKLHLGGNIGLVTRLTDAQDGSFPHALQNSITKAVMDVYDPAGHEEEVEMHDDGLHDDGAANDGIYGGYIPATQTGMYRATALIFGSTNGYQLIRSTQHLLPIVAEQLTFTGEAFAFSKDEEHVDIFVGVNPTPEALDVVYRGYTELWGHDAEGNEIPVCWLAGMVNVKGMFGLFTISFELNINWLKKAGARAPLTLKNVVLQDSNVFVPIAESAEINVLSSNVLPKVDGPMDIEITKEMKQGVMPKELFSNKNRTKAAPSLILIHGYCADVNPWQKYASDFTDATFFIEPSSSLTNQDFTNLILKHTEDLGMTSWSGIGHSQGGIVLAHILNYYFSGLDQSQGGVKIQSLGTPYHGNSGAGCAANLINIFGFGCGENFDLTTDGANLWLPGITTDTRNEVNYYTTTYQQGTWFGDYCNLAVNLLLKWPNDGTSELALSSLRGGKNQGNTEKWCHTTDMGYTAQYYDHDRNKLMNKLASR